MQKEASASEPERNHSLQPCWEGVKEVRFGQLYKTTAAAAVSSSWNRLISHSEKKKYGLRFWLLLLLLKFLCLIFSRWIHSRGYL